MLETVLVENGEHETHHHVSTLLQNPRPIPYIVTMITKLEQPRGWSPCNLHAVPSGHGVYVLRDQNQNILFIGSHRLREKLMGHLRANDVPGVKYFEWYQTDSPRTAKEKERSWIARYRPPFAHQRSSLTS